MDFSLTLPNLKEDKIEAQRRAIGVLHRRIQEGDFPPDVTEAIRQALDGQLPRW